jgi:hypothetical protein
LNFRVLAEQEHAGRSRRHVVERFAALRRVNPFKAYPECALLTRP